MLCSSALPVSLLGSTTKTTHKNTKKTKTKLYLKGSKILHRVFKTVKKKVQKCIRILKMKKKSIRKKIKKPKQNLSIDAKEAKAFM